MVQVDACDLSSVSRGAPAARTTIALQFREEGVIPSRREPRRRTGAAVDPVYVRAISEGPRGVSIAPCSMVVAVAPADIALAIVRDAGPWDPFLHHDILGGSPCVLKVGSWRVSRLAFAWLRVGPSVRGRPRRR